MNKHLQDLIELSDVDAQIDSFEPKIEQINAVLNEKLAHKQDIVAKCEGLDDEAKSTRLKIQKNELHLQELSDKIEDIAKKSGTLKTEKEIKAIQLEEELAKEQINFANEEIERLGKLLDSFAEKKTELETEQKTVEEEITNIEGENKKEIEAIEKEKSTVFTQKDKLLSSMDQKIISFYQKIRRWAGNTTVVPVYKQSCGGCFLRLNDRTYGDIIKADEIITCPHCGRILYVKEVKEAQEA